MSAAREIRLEPVTAANWKQVIALELAEGQENFVESNVYSIAQSKFEPSLLPMAIYDGDQLVGFTLYGYDVEHQSYAIQRLMIDRHLQGQGYGRAGMVELIRRMSEIPGCREIYLSFQPDNVVGEHIYESLGFVKTGEVVEYGSLLARLVLPHNPPPQASSVELRPITSENFEQCVRLRTSPEQEAFVASNEYSLAQAFVNKTYVPLAIYDGETMVGFVMYGFEPEDHDGGQWWIHRLLIDAPLQGRGYGRLALLEVIKRMKRIPGCTEAAISWVPENTIGAALYNKLGFTQTGEIFDGEIVARMRLTD
jgi:diamine N-acetyltransferase